MPDEKVEITNSADPAANQARVDKLVQAMDTAYNRPGKLIWRSFLSGLFSAIGATLGAAVFFIIVIYILQALGGITLLQPTITKLEDMISSSILKQDQAQQQQQLNQLIQQQNQILEQNTATPTPTPKP